ncbi:hypothetical protein [Flavilitoribacter nigricans]|uniref:hypothetical protein n=1 Tax=Flavilitoribacter nigricans TaxID=70997 RepID=UPI00117B4DB0|nr:hypothetical protein [Flavilitoribacter nigricans]
MAYNNFFHFFTVYEWATDDATGYPISDISALPDPNSQNRKILPNHPGAKRCQLKPHPLPLRCTGNQKLKTFLQKGRKTPQPGELVPILPGTCLFCPLCAGYLYNDTSRLNTGMLNTARIK